MPRLIQAAISAISVTFILVLTAILAAGGPQMVLRLILAAGAALGLYVSVVAVTALASAGHSDPYLRWDWDDGHDAAEAMTRDDIPAVPTAPSAASRTTVFPRRGTRPIPAMAIAELPVTGTVVRQAAVAVVSPARDAADDLLARTRREFAELIAQTNAAFERSLQA